MTVAARAGVGGPIPKQFFWNGVRVPYIAPWPAEAPRPRSLVRRRWQGGVRLGYSDEALTADRFETVLWTRVPFDRGKGTPNLAGVHALRSRRCVTRMLCQICGGPTVGSRSDERHLFVMRASDGSDIAEGEVTAVPPIHETCAGEAVRDCPKLRQGYRAALVKYTETWGVAGIAYDPKTLRVLPPDDEEDGLSYAAYSDESHIRWILAAREVVSLHGVEPVGLSDLGLVA